MRIFQKIKNLFTKQNLVVVKDSIVKMSTFVLLLTSYLVSKFIDKIFHWRLFPKTIAIKLEPRFDAFFVKIIRFLDPKRIGTISRVDLIGLSVRNMKAKKTRTIVTIGGMMIGVGAIVFLVSIGYGFERLVITRVARLEEMKQTDVSLQAGGKIKINDKTLSDFKSLQNVNLALPLIAVVGRVNYLNSVTDMAAYGVTTDYLKQSAVKPVEGKIFDSNELSFEVSNLENKVAGVSTEMTVGAADKVIQNIDFTINPEVWIKVRESPSISGKILGYTKRVEGIPQGQEVWGGSYISEDGVGSSGSTEYGTKLGKWVKSSVLLWNQENCDPASQGDCEEGKYMVARDNSNEQIQKTGYFAEIGITLKPVNITETTPPEASTNVLGASTNVSGSSDGSDSSVLSAADWVEIASESGIVQPPEIKKVDLSTLAKKQAVVNRAVLAVLGIKENEAIGKKFSASFVVVGDLLGNSTENIESNPTEYTIVGVTPEDKTPILYVPFMDVRSVGITNFSQAKVVVKNQGDLSKVRQQIESMGYVTTSVADTVAQINSLFTTVRTVLMLLGMVALAVAALGMFNTLTVSLMERTREVGLMKAMGMKSSEVQELFLTESMIMGFFGGILGIVLGWVLGKVIGFILSFFSVFKGLGFIDVSYIPITFILIVLILSLLVGLITGIYPAKRATRISALNALRYE